jgi:hypothetical protein
MIVLALPNLASLMAANISVEILLVPILTNKIIQKIDSQGIFLPDLRLGPKFLQLFDQARTS